MISLSSPLAYTIALHLTKIILPRWCDCSRFDLHFPCKVCIQNYIQDEPKWVAYSRDADTDSSEQRKNYLQSLKGIPVAWSFIHARSDSEIALTSESKHSIDMLYNTCMSCRHFGISTDSFPAAEENRKSISTMWNVLCDDFQLSYYYHLYLFLLIWTLNLSYFPQRLA